MDCYYAGMYLVFHMHWYTTSSVNFVYKFAINILRNVEGEWKHMCIYYKIDT